MNIYFCKDCAEMLPCFITRMPEANFENKASCGKVNDDSCGPCKFLIDELVSAEVTEPFDSDFAESIEEGVWGLKAPPVFPPAFDKCSGT
jgi:hypothetical protein